MFDDSEKFPAEDMNSGDPLRSEGFDPPVMGGPLGWFRKLASGVIPNSFTIPGIDPGWSIGPPKRKWAVNLEQCA